jgi:ABC-type transport system involved in cytochrome c biogenesis ATPase subunit
MTIGDTDRIGLIAGNGGGKTTLLRCLAGLAEPTIGDVVRSRGMRVGYVEQDVPEKLLNLPLAEAIRRALPPVERFRNVPGEGVEHPSSLPRYASARLGPCFPKEPGVGSSAS